MSGSRPVSPSAGPWGIGIGALLLVSLAANLFWFVQHGAPATERLSEGDPSAPGAGAVAQAGVQRTRAQDLPSSAADRSSQRASRDAEALARLRAENATLMATVAALEAAQHDTPITDTDETGVNDELARANSEALEEAAFYADSFQAAAEFDGFEAAAADATYQALAAAGIEKLPQAVECTSALCRMDFPADATVGVDVYQALIADEHDELNAVTIRLPDGTSSTYIARPGHELPKFAGQ